MYNLESMKGCTTVSANRAKTVNARQPDNPCGNILEGRTMVVKELNLGIFVDTGNKPKLKISESDWRSREISFV